MNFLRGLFGKSTPKPARRLFLNGPGTYWLGVVGESYYHAHLVQLSRRIKEESPGRRYTTATLVFDDTNPHDANAIRVMIGGGQVGHLSRADAVEYRTQMKPVGKPWPEISCNAVIVGGTAGKENFGVWLDMPGER